MMRLVLVIAASLAAALFLLTALAFHSSTDGRIEDRLVFSAANGAEKLQICLDGISFDLISELRREGRFRIFRRPSLVISPFPTMTNVAMADLLGAERNSGYEGLYFDKRENRLGGGSRTYLRRGRARDGYHLLLDYEEPKAFEFLVYLFPQRIFRADLKRALAALGSADKRRLRLFIKSTDGLVHVGGRAAARAALAELDLILEKIYQERKGGIEIALFSDHGNSFVPSRLLPLEEHLERSGYKFDRRIAGPKSIVAPAFGLVGFAAIYCRQEERAAVAAALAGLEGVEVAVYLKGGAARAVGPDGEAEILFDEETNRYAYLPARGDPLGLLPIARKLEAEGKLSSGWADEADWFAATREHSLPDPLHRLYRGLKEQVVHNADVLVSFKDGYFYGNKLFDKIVSIEATHGSLRRASSAAFFMSTAREAPPALRSAELRRYLE